MLLEHFQMCDIVLILFSLLTKLLLLLILMTNKNPPYTISDPSLTIFCSSFASFIKACQMYHCHRRD